MAQQKIVMESKEALMETFRKHDNESDIALAEVVVDIRDTLVEIQKILASK